MDFEQSEEEEAPVVQVEEDEANFGQGAYSSEGCGSSNDYNEQQEIEKRLNALLGSTSLADAFESEMHERSSTAAASSFRLVQPRPFSGSRRAYLRATKGPSYPRADGDAVRHRCDARECDPVEQIFFGEAI